MLEDLLRYGRAILAIPVLWGLPTAVVYLLVRKAYSGFSTPLKLVIAYQGAGLAYAVSTAIKDGGVHASAESIVSAGILVWLALRPGRFSLAAILVYQAIGLIFSGMVPLFGQPLGSPAHRLAVAIIVWRAIFVMIAARELRIRLNPASPIVLP